MPRVFEPWARLLCDQLELALGDAVLDVACGPGSLSRVASECVGAGGRVTACDLSPAMLALARAKPPVEGGARIEYLEAPADRLPVRIASYDFVTCQQGLQFFGDRPAAVAQMHRALRPGGSAGIAVWTEIAHSPAMAAVADAIEEVAGAELAEPLPRGPVGLPGRRPARRAARPGRLPRCPRLDGRASGYLRGRSRAALPHARRERNRREADRAGRRATATARRRPDPDHRRGADRLRDGVERRDRATLAAGAFTENT